MPKYKNGVIYKLCHCNDLENENIYIGSTTNFRTRKNNHKKCCNNENCEEYNRLVYQFIRNNGGWSEWKMIPIEKYPCNGKEELKIRERYYIEFFKSKLNKQMPSRTKKQYRNDNKEIILEKKKLYFNANKEIISEKRKEKVICNHCCSEIRKDSLSRHKKSNKCKNYNITIE